MRNIGLVKASSSALEVKMAANTPGNSWISKQKSMA